MFKKKSKRSGIKLAESSVLLFKKAVQKLPVDVNEGQIQSLIEAIECTNYGATEHVVVKRNLSPGLYVVISGKVEAVSNSGVAVRLIKKGDFFGELSTFFGIPAPITVRAQEG